MTRPRGSSDGRRHAAPCSSTNGYHAAPGRSNKHRAYLNLQREGGDTTESSPVGGESSEVDMIEQMNVLQLHNETPNLLDRLKADCVPPAAASIFEGSADIPSPNHPLGNCDSSPEPFLDNEVLKETYNPNQHMSNMSESIFDTFMHPQANYNVYNAGFFDVDDNDDINNICDDAERRMRYPQVRQVDSPPRPYQYPYEEEDALQVAASASMVELLTEVTPQPDGLAGLIHVARDTLGNVSNASSVDYNSQDIRIPRIEEPLPTRGRKRPNEDRPKSPRNILVNPNSLFAPSSPVNRRRRLSVFTNHMEKRSTLITKEEIQASSTPTSIASHPTFLDEPLEYSDPLYTQPVEYLEPLYTQSMAYFQPSYPQPVGDSGGFFSDPMADSEALNNEPMADSGALNAQTMADSDALNNEPMADSGALNAQTMADSDALNNQTIADSEALNAQDSEASNNQTMADLEPLNTPTAVTSSVNVAERSISRNSHTSEGRPPLTLRINISRSPPTIATSSTTTSTRPTPDPSPHPVSTGHVSDGRVTKKRAAPQRKRTGGGRRKRGRGKSVAPEKADNDKEGKEKKTKPAKIPFPEWTMPKVGKKRTVDELVSMKPKLPSFNPIFDLKPGVIGYRKFTDLGPPMTLAARTALLLESKNTVMKPESRRRGTTTTYNRNTPGPQMTKANYYIDDDKVASFSPRMAAYCRYFLGDFLTVDAADQTKWVKRHEEGLPYNFASRINIQKVYERPKRPGVTYQHYHRVLGGRPRSNSCVFRDELDTPFKRVMAPRAPRKRRKSTDPLDNSREYLRAEYLHQKFVVPNEKLLEQTLLSCRRKFREGIWEEKFHQFWTDPLFEKHRRSGQLDTFGPVTLYEVVPLPQLQTVEYKESANLLTKRMTDMTWKEDCRERMLNVIFGSDRHDRRDPVPNELFIDVGGRVAQRLTNAILRSQVFVEQCVGEYVMSVLDHPQPTDQKERRAYRKRKKALLKICEVYTPGSYKVWPPLLLAIRVLGDHADLLPPSDCLVLGDQITTLLYGIYIYNIPELSTEQKVFLMAKSSKQRDQIPAVDANGEIIPDVYLTNKQVNALGFIAKSEILVKKMRGKSGGRKMGKPSADNDSPSPCSSDSESEVPHFQPQFSPELGPEKSRTPSILAMHPSDTLTTPESAGAQDSSAHPPDGSSMVEDTSILQESPARRSSPTEEVAMDVDLTRKSKKATVKHVQVIQRSKRVAITVPSLPNRKDPIYEARPWQQSYCAPTRQGTTIRASVYREIRKSMPPASMMEPSPDNDAPASSSSSVIVVPVASALPVEINSRSRYSPNTTVRVSSAGNGLPLSTESAQPPPVALDPAQSSSSGNVVYLPTHYPSNSHSHMASIPCSSNQSDSRPPKSHLLPSTPSAFKPIEKATDKSKNLKEAMKAASKDRERSDEGPSQKKKKERLELPVSQKDHLEPSSSKNKSRTGHSSSKPKDHLEPSSSKHNDHMQPSSSKHNNQMEPSSSKQKDHLQPSPSKPKERSEASIAKQKDPNASFSRSKSHHQSSTNQNERPESSSTKQKHRPEASHETHKDLPGTSAVKRKDAPNIPSNSKNDLVAPLSRRKNSFDGDDEEEVPRKKKHDSRKQRKSRTDEAYDSDHDDPFAKLPPHERPEPIAKSQLAELVKQGAVTKLQLDTKITHNHPPKLQHGHRKHTAYKHNELGYVTTTGKSDYHQGVFSNGVIYLYKVEDNNKSTLFGRMLQTVEMTGGVPCAVGEQALYDYQKQRFLPPYRGHVYVVHRLCIGDVVPEKQHLYLYYTVHMHSVYLLYSQKYSRFFDLRINPSLRYVKFTMNGECVKEVIMNAYEDTFRTAGRPVRMLRRPTSFLITTIARLSRAVKEKLEDNSRLPIFKKYLNSDPFASDDDPDGETLVPSPRIVSYVLPHESEERLRSAQDYVITNPDIIARYPANNALYKFRMSAPAEERKLTSFHCVFIETAIEKCFLKMDETKKTDAFNSLIKHINTLMWVDDQDPPEKHCAPVSATHIFEHRTLMGNDMVVSLCDALCLVSVGRRAFGGTPQFTNAMNMVRNEASCCERRRKIGGFVLKAEITNEVFDSAVALLLYNYYRDSSFLFLYFLHCVNQYVDGEVPIMAVEHYVDSIFDSVLPCTNGMRILKHYATYLIRKYCEAIKGRVEDRHFEFPALRSVSRSVADSMLAVRNMPHINSRHMDNQGISFRFTVRGTQFHMKMPFTPECIFPSSTPLNHCVPLEIRPCASTGEEMYLSSSTPFCGVYMGNQILMHSALWRIVHSAPNALVKMRVLGSDVEVMQSIAHSRSGILSMAKFMQKGGLVKAVLQDARRTDGFNTPFPGSAQRDYFDQPLRLRPMKWLVDELPSTGESRKKK